MVFLENIVFENGEWVDKSWIKRFHWGVPDEEGEKRERIRERLAALGHCKECSALSGCYFANFNKPKKHPNCDCKQLPINKPINEARAICDIRKFTEYVFHEKYIEKGKNKLFGLLGFLIEDSAYLKSEYEEQARTKYLRGEYVLGKLDEYGQRIDITINVHSSSRSNIEFVSGWMVHPLGLITCTTPLGG